MFSSTQGSIRMNNWFSIFFVTIVKQLLQEAGCLLSMEGLYSFLQFCSVSTLIQMELLVKWECFLEQHIFFLIDAYVFY